MEPHLERLLRGSDELPLGVSQLGLATADQLCRLHYKNSLTHVKELLKALETEGYVRHAIRPTDTAARPFYYMLAEKGVRYLRSLGMDAEAAHPVKSKLFLDHALEVGDVIISAMKVSEASKFYLYGFTPERTMKKDRRYTDVVPDALLDFGIKGTALKLAVLVEHDRSTEERVFFQRKIRGYVNLIRSSVRPPWLEAQNFIIAFTVFDNPRRLHQLLEWTESELTNDRDIWSAFLFADVPTPPGGEVWISPIWHTLSGEVQALLEK